jgi:hypothetical protein
VMVDNKGGGALAELVLGWTQSEGPDFSGWEGTMQKRPGFPGLLPSGSARRSPETSSCSRLDFAKRLVQILAVGLLGLLSVRLL